MAATSPGIVAPAKRKNPIVETYDDLVRLFANVGFAVVLLFIWAILTLIGVIVDQGKDTSFYTTNYAPPLARLVLRLHVDNIYHSAAYIGILGLIVVSMTVATFKRVIPARLPPYKPVKIDKMPLNASVTIAGDEATVRERVQAFFADRGWQLRKREFEGSEWTFADKHDWARRGVLVTHVGFIVIALGTTIYWWKGYSGQTTALSGTTVTIPENGATIHLDRFGYRYDKVQTKAGLVYQPIDYVSHVHYRVKGGPLQEGVIRVNAPLDVDGTLVYQASYGFATTFHVEHDGKPIPGIPTTPLLQGQAFPIGTSTKVIQYSQFVPTLDPRTGQPGLDPRPTNPAVVVRAFDGGNPLGQVAIPIGGSIDLGAGYRLYADRWTLYSGYQYRYDPGIPIVLIGAIVLVAGLCMCFFLLPARLYVHLTGEKRTWRVGIAATTVKGFQIYEEQFRGLVAALERTDDADAGTNVTSATPAGVV
jgi:cytochrome c biogenesis protein